MRTKHAKARIGKTLSILLVGEHQVILQAMKHWLAPLGHQLTWVKNGLEAIHQLRLRHFDMVVTELTIPGLDGSLIAQYLRSTNDHATLIGLSSVWYHDRSCASVTDSPAELRLIHESAACAGA